jgi:hypothetical protein
VNTPKIDGLRPAYYNKTEDRFLSIAPTGNFDEWEPVLLLTADGGLDVVMLDATTAAWLLPDIAKLTGDFARWAAAELSKEKVR